MRKIADAIRKNDVPAYQQARYPLVPDGEPLVFQDEDFSGVNFEGFSLGFSEFHYCNLDDAEHLHGQPITFEDTTARRIDLRGVSMILRATNSNLEGMLYDENTRLSYDDTTFSQFKDCMVDDDTKRYFAEQGVEFS